MATSIKSLRHPSPLCQWPSVDYAFPLVAIEDHGQDSHSNSKAAPRAHVIHKDKDLDSDVKSEDEDDDESTTSILVVELWQGQMAVIIIIHLIEY
jgi:hypothetical protein